MRTCLLAAVAFALGGCDELFGLDPVPPPDAAIQPGDLVLAYAFEEPAGSMLLGDDSGNGNAAMLYGPVFDAGHYGTGLVFDGFDDHAVASNSPSIDISDGGLTIAAWVRVDVAAAVTDEAIIAKLWSPLGTFEEPYYQYAVEYRPTMNALALLLPDASGVSHSVYRLGGVSGSFQHVAFTYDGTTVRGYLDGVELLSAAAAAILAKRDTQLVLGVDGDRRQAFRGELDNVRIYRRALAADEILADRDTR